MAPKRSGGSSRKRCKDCPPESKSTAKYPGPRCLAHHRAKKRADREKAWERRIWASFKMTAARYYAILEFQGGCCYWCRRAKGIAKKLAIDHDHACCPTTPTCGECTRGLLCATCNKTLGHFRDDPAAVQRGATYLISPPAKAVQGASDVRADERRSLENG